MSQSSIDAASFLRQMRQWVLSEDLDHKILASSTDMYINSWEMVWEVRTFNSQNSTKMLFLAAAAVVAAVLTTAAAVVVVGMMLEAVEEVSVGRGDNTKSGENVKKEKKRKGR